MNKTGSITLSKFFKESRKPLGYGESYTEEELIEEVSLCFIEAIPGYRDGVILVPICPVQMLCSVVPMSPNLEF